MVGTFVPNKMFVTILFLMDRKDALCAVKTRFLPLKPKPRFGVSNDGHPVDVDIGVAVKVLN